MARFLDLEKAPDALTRDDLSYIGTYALMAASLSTERSGGIPSIPEKETVLSKLLKTQKSEAIRLASDFFYVLIG